MKSPPREEEKCAHSVETIAMCERVKSTIYVHILKSPKCMTYITRKKRQIGPIKKTYHLSNWKI